jgi:hypothetical protein
VRITFKYKYPIERTMEFEQEYHENLRLALEDKIYLLERAITIWMFDGEELVGETYGISLADNEDELPGCPTDASAIYCYSNTILGKHKGKGYGTILKAAFIGRVSRDFQAIYGHARPGASQALNRKFGAKFLKTYEDWYGTGETYGLYVLKLDGGENDEKK